MQHFLSMKFAQDLIDKRTEGNIGITDAAKQAGVSTTAFFRGEIGKLTDIEKFAALCKWLEKPIQSYFLNLKKINYVGGTKDFYVNEGNSNGNGKSKKSGRKDENNILNSGARGLSSASTDNQA